MAAYVVKTFGVFSYLPVLLFAGTAAGAAIGPFRRSGVKTDRECDKKSVI